jgi:hypothetical protein
MTDARPGDGSFVDLEVRIFQRRERGYPVELTLGEGQEYPRAYLACDVVPWVPRSDRAAEGRRLLDAFLADSGLREAWAEARGQAPRRRIRLRIDPASAELHALPWELLQEGATTLSAGADTPFSRYLPIALPWGGAVEERPIRALVVISDPEDIEERHHLAHTNVAREREIIASAFSEAAAVEVDFLEPPVTPERLEERLREGYHVLHYIGHGAYSSKREQAVLYVQDEEGKACRLFDHELASMLARQGARPRLVFLAACQSAIGPSTVSLEGSEPRSSGDAFLGLAPKLVAVGVPAVVAMQDLVTVESVLKLSQVFYRRLLEHGQVDLAMNEARSTLLTAGRPDAGVPVLFMRLKSGQIWGGEADARGEVLGARSPQVFWTGLLRMIERGKCTPIIGPRVRGQWLPSPSQIAVTWAQAHGYPFADRDNLARVAQYLASNQGADFPRYELVDTLMCEFATRVPQDHRPDDSCQTLTDLIQSVGWANLVGDPNEVHQVLASLDLPLYLTTNCDGCMAEALAAQGKAPVREICLWNETLYGQSSLFDDDPTYEPTAEAPLVYHLFGSDEVVESLVLTEDNALDFLVRVSAEMERIPPAIWAALANSSLMFLGYSLDDWEFRVILRGLVATRGRRRRFKHVAVQLEQDDVERATAGLWTGAVQNFLEQYFQDAEINVFWGSVEQFVAELRERWEASRG